MEVAQLDHDRVSKRHAWQKPGGHFTLARRQPLD